MKNVFNDARRRNLAKWLPKHLIEPALATLGEPPKSFRRQFFCEAHARTTGKPCRAHALANGRCKNHGGMSTGPKTAEGRARISEVQKRRWAKWRENRAAEKTPSVLRKCSKGEKGPTILASVGVLGSVVIESRAKFSG